MLLRSHRSRRPGTTMVEGAIVYPVALLLTFGLIVFGLGMFRYQQVAALAREGARYASVHGGQWAKELNNNTPTTKDDIYNTAVKPMAAGLDLSQLQVTSVTYADSSQLPTYTDGSGNTKTNTVTVTVTYTWTPELFGTGVTMTSTSVMPVTY
jgi:Flp pilus assembly protein TadG